MKKNYFDIIKEIQEKVKGYIVSNKLQSLVIGISGGLDSGIGAAVLSPVCKELGIPLIGRYIHIESNSDEEKRRAELIGNAFCTDFKVKKLTEPYRFLVGYTDEPTLFGGLNFEHQTYEDKIRRGNIKVRMRMIYLYNLSQKTKGIIVGCNNKTEDLLGFFTIGDSGDINPFINLYKTEIYQLSRDYLSLLTTKEEIEALQSVIDAVPTDGLGITSSDVEQFGVPSYDAVDEILVMYNKKKFYGKIDDELAPLYEKYGKESTWKVINRHLNSEFKRHHPHKIILI